MLSLYRNTKHAIIYGSKGVSHAYILSTCADMYAVANRTDQIPFLKNRHFVSRKSELNVLKQNLMVEQKCNKMSIVGLGGTGKTQIVLQFAYLVKETWSDFLIF